MWHESRHLLLESFCASQGETRGINDFISVLMFYREYPACEVEAAVEPAIENNIRTTEDVCHILIYTKRPCHQHSAIS